MAFLQDKKKKKNEQDVKSEVETEAKPEAKRKTLRDYGSTDTVPRSAFNPLGNNRERSTYHGYNRRKDAVLRMDRETQQKIKAMAKMSTKQLGSSMKDVIDNIVDITLSGFDDFHYEWYKDNLEKIIQEDEMKQNEK